VGWWVNEKQNEKKMNECYVYLHDTMEKKLNTSASTNLQKQLINEIQKVAGL
jgi:hypothetical protein